MNRRRVVVTWGLALLLPCLGCGYFPLRWPKRELWSAGWTEPLTITLPLGDAVVLPVRVEQERVMVAAEFLDPERTVDVFHANLLRNHIQPLLLVLRNGSEQPYRFRKADVDARYVPAAQAARWACVHPAVTAARLIRWGVFFLPGLLMESVVEPTTTLDFPVFEELARRPERTDSRQIIVEFQRHEIADGDIGPDEIRAGAMFLRPPRLGSVIAVRLVNARTQQPLVLKIPAPPPVYEAHGTYPHSYETVWNAALEAGARIKSWRVASSDPKTGVIAVRHGLRFLTWSTVTRITIAVHALAEARPAPLTQVTVQSTLRRRDTTGSGEHSRTIEQFFFELGGALPAPVAEPLENPTGPSTRPGSDY